jgi:hypothetical protein
MPNTQTAAEHYLKFHRRQWFIYLAGCAAMGVGTIVSVLLPGDNPRVVLPAVSPFVLMFALALVERVRHREAFARETKRIWSDEWTREGMRRAHGLALVTVLIAQAPLMFFMAYVPDKPSVAGMGGVTIMLGCGMMAAGFLYFTRAGRDD